MFLKSTLEDELIRSLSEYNPPIEQKQKILMKIRENPKSGKLRIIHSKNDYYILFFIKS